MTKPQNWLCDGQRAWEEYAAFLAMSDRRGESFGFACGVAWPAGPRS
jgi:hypothetical protein